MKRKKREEYCKELEVVKNGEYILVGDYINRDTETMFLHSKCNRKFELTPKKFYKNKYPCPYCRPLKKHENTIKKTEEFNKEVRKLCGNEYSVIGEYNGNKAKIAIRHNCRACENYVFYSTPNNFLRGHGCPKCNPSGTSIPELCLLYAIQEKIPCAQKKNINKRECDIYFELNSKEICIQYDGVFFHKDVERDEGFNRSFLKKSNRILFRVREENCCELLKMKYMYVEKASPKYSITSLQKNIDNIFLEINKICNADFHPVLTKEMMNRAKKESGLRYFYKRLAKDYKEFVLSKGHAPKGKEENDLRGRLNRALRDGKFEDVDKDRIISLRRKVGDIKERREANEIFKDLCIFFNNNTFLPRQQVDGKELELYNEVKYCLNKKQFSKEQHEKYQIMYSKSENCIETEKELLAKLEIFVEESDRFPKRSSNEVEEKSLISKISHRISRKSCSEEFIEKVNKYRSSYEQHVVIMRRYIKYELENNRLPSSNSKDYKEKSLANGMQRYLKSDIYNRDEKEKLLSIRAKHLTLKELINDAVRYLGVDEDTYVLGLYAEFKKRNGKIPKLNKENKYEDNLYHLVKTYINKGKFCEKQRKNIIYDYEIAEIEKDGVKRIADDYLLYFKKNNKSPKRNSKLYKDTKRIIEKYKNSQHINISEVVKIFNGLKCNLSAQKTFDEAMKFYKIHGRMPRHVTKNGDEAVKEKRLAARITQMCNTGFTEEQKCEIESKLFLNKERPRIAFEKLLDYYEKNNRAPKHTDGKEEKKILNNVRAHMKAGHYDMNELKKIYFILPYSEKSKKR